MIWMADMLTGVEVVLFCYVVWCACWSKKGSLAPFAAILLPLDVVPVTCLDDARKEPDPRGGTRSGMQ